MNKILFTLLIFSILLLPKSTLAWGRDGHRMVAEIAFQMLSQSTKDKLMSYLGSISLDDASNWMDEQRGNNTYRYLTTTHYINIDKGQKLDPFQKNNIYTELNEVISDLGKNTNPAEIKIDLLILLHLVGDIHQPLHDGYSNDKGGNSINVTIDGKTTNLHSAWDGGIIQRMAINKEKIMLLYPKLSKAELDQIKNISVAGWISESRTNLDQVYSFKNSTLDQEYQQKASVIIEQQILKAGIRLSAVLEKVLATKAVNTVKEEVKAVTVLDKPISAAEAAKHMGETATVCDKVFGAKYLETTSSAPTFLNMGAPYPNSPFSVVIFGSNRPNFKEKPELYYDNKKVCVTGLIKEYKGKPEMIISKEADITIEK